MLTSSVTLVIPVYNDINALKVAVPKALEIMGTLSSDFEIIIAEDASTDGSAEYASSCAEKTSHVRHLHREERKGRGSALTSSVNIARGDIFCYFDVDMATDMGYLLPLLQAVDTTSDVATGSRLLPESSIKRSLDRELKSQGYNILVRFFLRSRLRDHQCGFKAFKTESLRKIIPYVTDTHWFWDTEVLVRAQRMGFVVTEIPVIWKEGEGTTVKTSDIWRMGRSIFRLWWNLLIHPLTKQIG